MQLVLPELLLPRLVKERELADVVAEDVAEDGQAGVERRDLADVGLEWRAEAAEGRGRVELGDLPFCLLADELPFKVWCVSARKQRSSKTPTNAEKRRKTNSALVCPSVSGLVVAARRPAKATHRGRQAGLR